MSGNKRREEGKYKYTYIYIKEDNLFAFASRGHQQTAACFPPAALTADVTYLIISLIGLDDKTERRLYHLALSVRYLTDKKKQLQDKIL